MTYDILIVDDQEDIRQLLSDILTDEGYSTRVAATGHEALEAIKAKRPHVILLDVWLKEPHCDGLHVLDLIRQIHPTLPVVMISGHSSIETAINALKAGAYDFIEKPFKTERLMNVIARALDHGRLHQEIDALRSHQNHPLDFLGQSPLVEQARHFIAAVSKTKSRVLLTGPSGVGKKLVASLIHKQSTRAMNSFIIVKCGSLSVESFDSDFYGKETPTSNGGAPLLHVGLLEKAQGGTIVFDDVDRASPTIQECLLKVVQDQRYQRVGGKTTLENDVRFISLSERNLEQLVALDQFRSDLFYRLNVMPFDLSPLADRPEDVIPLLTSFFEAQGEKRISKRVSLDARMALESYNWPGNVRQLRNLVEWLHILHGDAEEITASMLPIDIQSGSQGEGEKFIDRNHLLTLQLKDAREAFEKAYLNLHMRRFNGNISKTAQAIGMERTALHRKIKMLQLVDEDEGSI